MVTGGFSVDMLLLLLCCYVVRVNQRGRYVSRCEKLRGCSFSVF